MILNSKGELSFEYKGNDLGVAFVIPQNVSQDGLYLIISFVNVGKIRLLNIFHWYNIINISHYFWYICNSDFNY